MGRFLCYFSSSFNQKNRQQTLPPPLLERLLFIF